MGIIETGAVSRAQTELADTAEPELAQKPHPDQFSLLPQTRIQLLNQQCCDLLNKRLLLQGSTHDIENKQFNTAENLSEARLKKLTKTPLHTLYHRQEIGKILQGRLAHGIQATDTIKSYTQRLKDLQIKVFQLEEAHTDFSKISTPSEQNKRLQQFERIPPDLRTATYKSLAELSRQIQILENISKRIAAGELLEDTYLEHLAHQVAYPGLAKGLQLPGGYKVDQVFNNTKGLIAYGLVATDPKSGKKPILLFQGTESETNQAHFLSQLRNNIAPEIGEAAILPDIQKLDPWLVQNPNTILTGHSLGGAKAQQLAAIHSKGISEIVTFCSPGVSQQTAEQFGRKKPGKVRHYLTENDPIVSPDPKKRVGETLLGGDVIIIPGYSGPDAPHSASALLDWQNKPEKQRPKLILQEAWQETMSEREKMRQSPQFQWIAKKLIPKAPKWLSQISKWFRKSNPD